MSNRRRSRFRVFDQILLGDDPPPHEQGPLAPAPGAIAVAQEGDIFLLGEHKIACGDATAEDVFAAAKGAWDHVATAGATAVALGRMLALDMVSAAKAGAGDGGKASRDRIL